MNYSYSAGDALKHITFIYSALLAEGVELPVPHTHGITSEENSETIEGYSLSFKNKNDESFMSISSMSSEGVFVRIHDNTETHTYDFNQVINYENIFKEMIRAIIEMLDKNVEINYGYDLNKALIALNLTSRSTSSIQRNINALSRIFLLHSMYDYFDGVKITPLIYSSREANMSFNGYYANMFALSMPNPHAHFIELTESRLDSGEILENIDISDSKFNIEFTISNSLKLINISNNVEKNNTIVVFYIRMLADTSKDSLHETPFNYANAEATFNRIKGFQRKDAI